MRGSTPHAATGGSNAEPAEDSARDAVIDGAAGLKRIAHHYANSLLVPRVSAPSAFELGEAETLDLSSSPHFSPRLRVSVSKWNLTHLHQVRRSEYSRIRGTQINDNPERRIGSAFSIMETVRRNVKRWRDDGHIERWVASGLFAAERNSGGDRLSRDADAVSLSRGRLARRTHGQLPYDPLIPGTIASRAARRQANRRPTARTWQAPGCLCRHHGGRRRRKDSQPSRRLWWCRQVV